MEYKYRSKVGESVKLWWMIFWRIGLIPLPVANPILTAWLIAAVGSVVLVASGHSVKIWPIVRLITMRNPVFKIRSSTVNPRSTYAPSSRKPFEPIAKHIPATPPKTRGEELAKASQQGRKTGFEPYVLEKMKLQKSPWIIGDPGFGLGDSGFDNSAVKAGQAGEVNFAKALQKTGLIDKFQSYWSVYLPARGSFTRNYESDADIDCILFNGKTIYLVDLKNYKGGAITYYGNEVGLSAVDDATQRPISISAKMSKNMKMAVERFETHMRYEGYEIKARVVLMPQNNGEGTVKGVFWPGHIPAMNLSDFIKELEQAPQFHNKDHSFFHHGMSTMVK